MIGDAINYPTQHDDWLKTILIGGALLFFSWLIIPAFILGGYQVRVLRSAAMDEETPPMFRDLGDMLVDGFKVFLIALAYILVIEVIIFIGLSIDSIIGTLITLVASLFFIVALYLLPVAMTNFALTGSMREAFDISTISSAGFTGQYLVAFVVAAVINFVFSIVGGLTVIIFFLGLFVMFFGTIVNNYIIGQGCGPALRQQLDEEIVAE